METWYNRDFFNCLPDQTLRRKRWSSEARNGNINRIKHGMKRKTMRYLRINLLLNSSVKVRNQRPHWEYCFTLEAFSNQVIFRKKDDSNTLIWSKLCGQVYGICPHELKLLNKWKMWISCHIIQCNLIQYRTVLIDMYFYDHIFCPQVNCGRKWWKKTFITGSLGVS